MDTPGLQLEEITEASDGPAADLTPRRWQSFERFGEISVGSVGHPNSCALPCKFFRRARGCKDGKHCTRCHVCAWRAVYKRVARNRDATHLDDTESVHSSTAPPSVLSNPDHTRFDEALSESGLAAGACACQAAASSSDPPKREKPQGASGLGLCLTAASSADPMKISSAPPVANWSLGSVGHPLTCARACKYRNRKGGCRDGRHCLSCHLCQWSRYASSKQEQPQQGEQSYSPGLELIGAVSPDAEQQAEEGEPPSLLAPWAGTVERLHL